MSHYKIIISGGGTGGHIFPAIAIANAFRRRYPDAEVLFVGAEGRMEMERVPAAGYRIIGLPVSGLDRRRPWRNIGVMRRLWVSLRRARTIVSDFQPDVAVGVGGYASGPLLRAAEAAGVPTLIQEQNSYAGITNKWLAKRAARICVAYPGMERFFPAEKIVLTGNPVRKDLEEAINCHDEALKHFGLDPACKTLLVLGGSLGARTINEAVEVALPTLADLGVQLIWQTGRSYYDAIRSRVADLEPEPKRWVGPFITRMDYAYAAADLVVSRAGASSISELCLLGKPAILVPSPNVAEDHQTKNARSVADRGGAVMIADGEVRKLLPDTLRRLFGDREQLKALGLHSGQLAERDSDERIVDELVALIENNKRLGATKAPQTEKKR